ncbi:MAG: DUF4926 domain-containing protein [Flavobacteriales bacterium]|nr:DUF4926 domain-containing protein [Flavobacteriales bacterium]
MKQKFEKYQQIQLAKALPEYHFQSGDAATIVETVSNKKGEKGYVLEFFDCDGETLKVITVAEDFIALPPKHGVVNFRPYKAA